MAYRAAMPKLLREVGWEVESDEFGEIEDPDPDNHEKRQRELIREIDEARTAAARQPEKRKWGLFKSGKLAEKKGWETYDDKMRGDPGGEEGKGKNVLFDIEAIRAELESEHMEVRQLESTLPPMKLDLNVPSPKDISLHRPTKSRTEGMLDQPQQAPYANLRETKSFDGMASNPHTKANDDVERCGSKPNPFTNNSHEYNDDDDNPLSPKAQVEPAVSFDKMHISHPSPSSTQEAASSTLPPRIVSPPSMPPPPASAQIPGLHHSTTTRSSGDVPTIPSLSSGFGVEHNAWADEDEIGKEKEMMLKF